MQPDPSQSGHVDVLVVGGGNGGISLAARLRRSGVQDIAIVEPKVTHHFRPLLSYVGAGLSSTSELSRRQASLMPKGVRWIQDAVAGIDAEASSVTLASGRGLTYGDVILTPGSEPDWGAVPGSAQAMLSPGASTNYVVDLAPKTCSSSRPFAAGGQCSRARTAPLPALVPDRRSFTWPATTGAPRGSSTTSTSRW